MAGAVVRIVRLYTSPFASEVGKVNGPSALRARLLAPLLAKKMLLPYS